MQFQTSISVHSAIYLSVSLTPSHHIVLYRQWDGSRDPLRLAFYFEREYRLPARDQTGVKTSGGGIMKLRVYPPPSPLHDDIYFKLCPVFTCSTEELQHSAHLIAG